MKKSALFLLMFLASCSTSVVPDGCPVIATPREATRQYISNANYDAFQINLVGNENYCYTDSSTNQRYAVITPIFQLRRLEDSSDRRVDTSFYVKTLGKGEYIGKQVHHQSLQIPLGVKEQTIKGNPVKLRVAQPPYDDFSLELGLNLSDYALSKSKGMFDINYKYFSDEDLANMEEPEEKLLEINPDEKVVYCPSRKQPIVVKKNSTNPCN